MKIALTSVIVDGPVNAFKFLYRGSWFHIEALCLEANLAIGASPEELDGTGLLLEPNNNPAASTFQQALYKGRDSCNCIWS